jgi:hypothetical protein
MAAAAVLTAYRSIYDADDREYAAAWVAVIRATLARKLSAGERAFYERALRGWERHLRYVEMDIDSDERHCTSVLL